MAEATYALEVDLNRDGDFSDTDEILSDRLLEAKWFNGFANMFDPVCRDSTAELTLDNRDGRLSPERVGAISGLTKGKVTRLTMNFAATDYRMFTGWVDRPVPAVGRFGSQTAKLVCNSWVTKAGKTKGFNVPVMTNTTVDAVLEQIIDRSACFPPGLDGQVWLLGLDGFTELDVTTYLSNASAYMAAEAGKSLIGMIGQKWGPNTSVFNACKELVGREFLGRLLLRRDGKLEFWNSDHLFLDYVSDKTYNDTQSVHGLEYEYGTLLYNRITVRAESSQRSSSPQVLGIVSDEIELGIGETKKVSCKYSDPANNVKASGTNALAPVQTTDFNAWSEAGGTGTNLTSLVTTAISREGGTSCEVSFTNTGSVPCFVQAGWQVRGTKILTFEATVTREDAASIQAYGPYEYSYGPMLERISDAESAGDFLLTMFKSPRGIVKSLTVNARASSSFMTDVLATLVVGARVTLQETQTGLNADYFIISEEHQVTTRPYRHLVKYGLEPCGGYAVWLLDVTGFSELGTTTILAPF